MRSFLQLPKIWRDIIIKKLDLLSLAPYASNNNVNKLQGIEDCYRLRVGNYRVLYRVIKQKLIIEIVNVAHRREAYQ